MIDGVFEVAIKVKKLDFAAEFYKQALGFKEGDYSIKSGNGCFFG